QGDGSPRRLLAGYYDRPLFPENFSADDAFDSWSNRSLDDWHTFYEGATRLADYLNYVGHNGLMLSVLADGSAIYPSRLVDSTPRYDTGAFFANGQDPLRKDVLELLFRIFDREGLTLIPAVDFSMPLKSLEALRRDGGPDSEGLELIGADGARWLDRHSARQGLAPYYNPLNEQVQTEMLAVVGELVERYGRHLSFGGVALQLSADGYAQLPGAGWGFDRRTLERFERDSGVKLPPTDRQFAQCVELLEGPERLKWLHWRANALSLFYRRMQSEIAAEKPGVKLYLAGARLFERPELASELAPVLSHSATKNQDVLLAVGIDPELYRDLDGVALLRPQRIAPLNSLPNQAVNLEINLDANLDRQFGASQAGSLFYHEPQEARLESFDAKSPFKKTYSWLAAQPSPGGMHNRRRFVHALATLDANAMFDGGWMLPLGQENELDDLIAVYRQLPPEPFETLSAGRAPDAAGAGPASSGGEATTQPVTIRTLSRYDRTYIYFVNDSPWKATVSLSVEMPDCAVRSLTRARRAPALTGKERRRAWSMALEPYDVFGAAFSSPNVRFSDPHVSLDERVPARLTQVIDELLERAAVLKNPPPLNVLENQDFEQTASSGIPGWETAERRSRLEQLEQLASREPPQGKVTLDAHGPRSGEYAVRLSAGGGPATLASAPFAAPRTGWLSVSVWLRAADAERQPHLWLTLEGRVGGQSYVRRAAVGQGPDSKPLQTEWTEYLFVFPDLPTEGVSPLRL
ncbi:MAG TPA: family 10 glycosylhydrolase, partial [Thermomicrobiales bacterium]|nr:family 10 glycosylhydrolase [Thermomicrobiales bacterium]